MNVNQVKEDIDYLRYYKNLKNPSITNDGKAYEVYERYGFLDPKYDSLESAVSALELRYYE